MYAASELLRAKGPDLYAISPDATVLDAAKAMNQHKIGALLVVGEGRLHGIITERDIMTRIVAAERPPCSTPVSAVMTRDVITCPRTAALDDLRTLMRERRIRHIPVFDGDRLAGMISIGDLNAAETENLTQTISYLEAYITS